LLGWLLAGFWFDGLWKFWKFWLFAVFLGWLASC
jgi:hypothetical protein